MKKYWSWIVWFILTVALSTYFAWPLVFDESSKEMYLIGKTTDGHHQIELACEGCHTSPFGGAELLQEACENCHLEELTAIRDSHPRRKFTDPSNADRVALLDARFCVTCHREHQEEITTAMGVSVPQDVCFLCHQDIGEERETHLGMEFDTCASSGCHNFHDNTALYEDFLVTNSGQAHLNSTLLVDSLNKVEEVFNTSESTFSSSLINTPDAPENFLQDEALISDWTNSFHAVADVNCLSCHQNEAQEWVAAPDYKSCEGCHSTQSEGFLEGKHGMRIKAGLSPMTVEMARIPMKDSAEHKELSCTSCHSSHEFNRLSASIDSCVGCHNSDHVLAYETSSHAQLSKKVFNGEAPEESAVTCATCHMPRETQRIGGVDVTHVQHNQNLNLRPNDKMLRSVCMNCHSLAFSLDALADQQLIENNFNGQPSIHIESIDMAVKRREASKDRNEAYQ